MCECLCVRESKKGGDEVVCKLFFVVCRIFQVFYFERMFYKQIYFLKKEKCFTKSPMSKTRVRFSNLITLEGS